ncbi:UDP-N-acetylglucosamine--N-acetylmuramyl-(pentapeptide) pyrophosphoryl-undecaprenol N-acetylglucosamine transferase [Candidatus Lariskella endosymbiont of Hedychridium roseum]|uniref:UDP-N-acetylglucosamine--N-acetylmuramyl- (pentapeptide) pyrophosphoryl-undecaprenol N-acetylglucosamine transferase n=1 Tax=Candidatus Lariskella endosymbiont of Hedychridium roseum TaxID=3077949 RepID=UPI0030D30ECF
MKVDKRNTVVIVTGGTGGHVYPAEALSRHIEKKFNVVFTIDDRGFNFIKDIVDVSKVFRIFSVSSATLLSSYIKILLLFVNCLRLLHLFVAIKPRCVVCFGGYASLAPAFAAFLMRIPVVVHEQNSVLGKSNKIISYFCRSLAVSFPDTVGLPSTVLNKVVVTGLPMRPELLDIARSTQYKAESTTSLVAGDEVESSAILGKTESDADHSILSILVIGGSQGAKVFSDIFPSAISLLPLDKQKQIAVTQQVRQEDMENVNEFYSKTSARVELSTFFKDIGRKIATHDLIVSRAGAATVFELILFQKQSILVPFPSAADNHQFHNAIFIRDNLGAILIPQDEFSSAKLCDIILRFLSNRSELKTSSKINRRFFCESAAKNLAELL